MNILNLIIYVLILIMIYIYFKKYCCKCVCKNKINIDVYVLSWKKVNDNALQIFKEVSRAFPNVYFIDCDETSNNNFKNIIRLTDKDYYGTQFDTAIKNSKEGSIVGIIVGDIKINFTDWVKVYNNTVTNFKDLDIGIYAPYEDRTHWQKNPKGEKMFDKNLNLTDNTDCTAWFLAPEIVSFAKKLNITKFSSYGWGVDILLCKYSNYIGKNVLFDKSVQVLNPSGTGYDGDKAHDQKDILYNMTIQNKLIPSTIPDRKVHFITFGDTKSRYNNSRIRIVKEAEDMNFFDTITGYTENSPELKNFFEEHKDFISKNKRGYGYWIWKFKIVLETFNKINTNDVVVYLDSGCVLNKEGLPRLKEYIELATLNDLVAFKLPESYKEYIWTKGDVLKKLDCDKDCYDTNQISCTSFMVRKCPRMLNFFTTLLEYAISNNYNLVNDSVSISPNIKGFIENRHDQSLYSVLIKKMLKNKIALLENEIDPGCKPMVGDGFFELNGNKYKFPIYAKRM